MRISLALNASRCPSGRAKDAEPASVLTGQGLGVDLLANALRRIAAASQTIGIGAVLVQAKDENARRFYMACAEFFEFPGDSRTLFLPIETVVAGFGEGA